MESQIGTKLADAKAALFSCSMDRGGTFLENPMVDFHVNGPDSKAPEILNIMLGRRLTHLYFVVLQ